MCDIFTVEKRSDIMSKIKSKNTLPELAVKAELKRKEIPFKMHATIIGHPDFVLHEMGIILFVDGEFWHGHTLTPAKREMLSEYWRKKLDRNMERDLEVTAALKKIGWAVIRVTDRDVKKRMPWVMSKIMKCNGQLTGKRRKTDPETRIAALKKTLIKKNTKCQKKKKTSKK